MSYLDPSYGSVPPAPAAPGRGRSVGLVVALAAVVAIAGIGVLLAGTGKGGDASGADTTRHVAGSIDPARIDAIVTDAHSGHYFANDHAKTYPAGFETGFVQGGLKAQPNTTNRLAACVLSYVETKWAFPELMNQQDRFREIGAEAGVHCARFA